jgi:CRISPR-associated protein Csm3
MEYKLLKKIIVRGTIEAKTGIAIGGSNTAMGIGGVDKGVIRNPVTQQPYIPGSTLKGKMRSLLELRDNSIGDKKMGAVKNGPSDKEGVRAVRLFGNASGGDHQRPSRIIVRDACLDKDQLENDFFKDTDLLFTEVKTEVVIDRITSKAMPRQLERVPAGAKFNFEMVLNVFEEDNEQELTQDLFASLQLVQNDYIGGSGSRGSGQVSFKISEVMERDNDFYMLTSDEKNRTSDFQKYFPK